MYYTKYRPQKFTEICRPNEAADVLAKQVQTGKTVHAYLFVGPRGTGKTTVARILAKALNCIKVKANGDPCDKCTNCESIKSGSYVDLIEIDAASNRGIDDIRDLKDKIKLAPTMGKKKIYIIDEVHMLTTEAFNALLKTLEEPPKNTHFILCTTEDHKVPATIKSRCQVFRFKRATVGQIVEKLNKIAESENIKISDLELKKIAEASLGGFRDAETLLQQVVEGDINIDSLLSASSKEKYIECVDYLINCKVSKALSIVNAVFEEGVDLYVWVGELLKYLRTLMFIKSGVSESAAEVTDEIIEATKQQAKKVDLKWLVNTTNTLLEAHKSIRSSFIPQLPVEVAIVEICSYGLEDDCSAQKKGGDDKGKVARKDDDADDLLEKGKDGSGLSERPIIPMKKIKSQWDSFIKQSRELNHSITALLTSSKPLRVEGSFLVLEVFYPFHKERLECARTRKLLEGLSKDVFGVPLTIKCVVSNEKPKKNDLTDMNVTIPSGVDNKSIIEAFDGGLPIMAKN
ncbi:DNA polymerase III subunit gamma/tau [candidate division WWE3 bacterium]|uniref:DNA polymerase III subunit gamma/tau n=1 Tax=candidate division WWE3 bacterium TaxID=2053526 RepID=A0A7X9HSQ0_UNCKA|nr:DNA polymerase III subunit gamma/tau [candidate division WWE3 bacterium]